MRLLLLFTTAIVFVLSAWKLAAAAPSAPDQFNILVNIAIGDEVPSETLDQGKKSNSLSSSGEVIYSFNSEYFSHPHIVYLRGGKATFVQLSIPSARLVEFQKLFISLGKPDLIQAKTETEVLQSFPSQGIAFLTEGLTGQVQRIQKFTPKTAKEFATEEGKNFKPVEFKPTMALDSGKIPRTVAKNNLIKSIFVMIGIAWIIVVLGTLIILWKRKH